MTSRATLTDDTQIALLTELTQLGTEAKDLVARGKVIRHQERVLIHQLLDLDVPRPMIIEASSYTPGHVARFVVEGPLDDNGVPLRTPLTPEERKAERESARAARVANTEQERNEKIAARKAAAAEKALERETAKAAKAAAKAEAAAAKAAEAVAAAEAAAAAAADAATGASVVADDATEATTEATTESATPAKAKAPRGAARKAAETKRARAKMVDA